MVMPSPFERMLQQASELAQSDTAGAFEQLETLYNKTLTDLDVRRLSGFAAHLGGALGRYEDTIEFLQRCLTHPALEDDGETAASIHRAIAVVATCAGDEELATSSIGAGVRNAVERCRVSLLTAQALATRGRIGEAVPHLAETTELMADVPHDDELRGQAATIGVNIMRLAEKRLTAARDGFRGATEVTAAALAHSDWASRHKALYHRARAEVLAGRPAQALALVQEMMALEKGAHADHEARFHTASLACRAQMVRGQFKIADGALGACRKLLDAMDEEARAGCEATLDELTAELEAAQAAVHAPA